MTTEITLTAEERDALADLWTNPDWKLPAFYESRDRWADAMAEYITAALSAVPRLALASPMVGELVATARDYDLWVGDYLSQGGLWNPEMADHAAVRDALIHFRDRFRAALTGEEGRDGE